MTVLTNGLAGSLILGVIKIKGNSLAPRLRAGDFVIVSGWALALRPCRPGDLVIFDQQEYGRLIKRVERVMPDGRLEVRGDDIDSTDSRLFGPVPPSALRARVLWAIRRSPSA